MSLFPKIEEDPEGFEKALDRCLETAKEMLKKLKELEEKTYEKDDKAINGKGKSQGTI